MAKKLKGDFFFLTANNLKTGKVVFYNGKDWSSNSSLAIKIPRNQLEKYEKISGKYEKNCIIVSPFFVELNSTGKIRTLRDKIRNKGLTFNL